MRMLAPAAAVAVIAGCGGASTVHYDRAAAMTCLRQTSSLSPVTEAERILMVFAGPNIPDAAVEAVAVGFGDGVADARGRAESLGSAPTGRFMGVLRHKEWTIERGDAYAYGTGAFEPAVAKRSGISDADAAAEIANLDATVKPSVVACLKRSER